MIGVVTTKEVGIAFEGLNGHHFDPSINLQGQWSISLIDSDSNVASN